MPEAKRARRRRDLARMKARAVRIYRKAAAVKLAEHLHPCSGPCCGNPRRWWGDKTMQELRADAL